jgi:hypothetical protein
MIHKNIRNISRLPSKSGEAAELLEPRDGKSSATNARKLQERWRNGEKTLPRGVPIYRGEGVVSRRYLKMTVAPPGGGRVYTPTFRR